MNFYYIVFIMKKKQIIKTNKNFIKSYFIELIS